MEIHRSICQNHPFLKRDEKTDLPTEGQDVFGFEAGGPNALSLGDVYQLGVAQKPL